MTQNSTQLTEIWNELSNAIDQMFQNSRLSQSAYSSINKGVMNYFRSSEYNDSLLRPSSNKTATNNKQTEGSDGADTDDLEMSIPGGQIYFRLKKKFKESLQKIAEEKNNLSDEDFLGFYAKTWQYYQTISRIMNLVFNHMNSHWIIRQQTQNRKDIVDVYAMAMKIWQDTFYKQNNHSLTRTCLNLIKKHRDNQGVMPNLIRQVVDSYISVDLTDADINNKNKPMTLSSLTTYKEWFEKQFIEETRTYYSLESDNYFNDNGFSSYIRKANNRLKEEEDRVQSYLHPSTLEILLRTVETQLIKKRLDDFYGQAEGLIKHEKIDDLELLFKLVHRIENAHAPIQLLFENRVYTVGINAVNCTKDTTVKDSKTYIEAIIKVYERFFMIVNKAFYCESGYMAAFDRACSKFINSNLNTEQTQKASRSAELLARYSDWLLRKGNKLDGDAVSEKINQMMCVFNYIHDKDIFQKFYGRFLAMRLIKELSASSDDEESVITKLKEMCGYEYASKLERMFKDIRLGADLNQSYVTHCENEKFCTKFHFHVTVLTSNWWPVTVSSMFNISNELLPRLTHFKDFYMKRYTGRKLNILFQYSKGEVQMLYTKPKYILQVSFYQMNILLLFNEFPTMTVEKMLEKTQIEANIFMPALVSLIKMKILNCQDIDPDQLNENIQETNLPMNNNITVNDAMKSDKIKINLMKMQQENSVNKIAPSPVYESVFEERKLTIQAVIVFIMKNRKALKHNLLLSEVIERLTRLFKPDIPAIKKCIDLLIEKQYMERDDKERDLYKYLA
ncbi:unnamed protein product [Rotaria magnacalcarata]|uniref:Cullin family profile domain-containing protein n=1 Tax=Rotaria magnacalcarata TaxID=392030 RepID=A0A816PCY1_9BILA|nr:unnamed protein product [Rotaria magnacalcarata]CAF3996839.1 unnamed protein product [Rotaria magnacalcarata]